MVLLKKVCLYISMLAFFALVGVAASPLKKAAEANGRAFSRQSIEAALGGKSSLWGLLGGYRSLISDFAWIKGYIDWERKDISGCISSIELATAIDPYMTIFWTQGAAMIAFDMPHWLLQKLPPTQRDEKALRTFKIRQSAIALKFLDKGLSLFPGKRRIAFAKGANRHFNRRLQACGGMLRPACGLLRPDGLFAAHLRLPFDEKRQVSKSRGNIEVGFGRMRRRFADKKTARRANRPHERNAKKDTRLTRIVFFHFRRNPFFERIPAVFFENPVRTIFPRPVLMLFHGGNGQIVSV